MTLCPDTGYLVRECFCSQCSEIRDEIAQLHYAKTRLLLSDAQWSEVRGVDARLKRLEAMVA